MSKISLEGAKCDRCGKEWRPRPGSTPKVCPYCHSPYWNVPRKPMVTWGLTKVSAREGRANTIPPGVEKDESTPPDA